MLMLEFRTMHWWYWLITVCLLTYGVTGRQVGFLLAIGLTLIQLAHFWISQRGMFTFPVQVRLGYLLLLLIALPDDLQWIYWVPMIGTWAQVFFGYCAMARIVSLLPWNRRAALSPALIWRTFVSAPVRGSLLSGGAARRTGQEMERTV